MFGPHTCAVTDHEPPVATTSVVVADADVFDVTVPFVCERSVWLGNPGAVDVVARVPAAKAGGTRSKVATIPAPSASVRRLGVRPISAKYRPHSLTA